LLGFEVVKEFMQTLSFQLVALKNRDRVRLTSTLALIETQLRCRWVETFFNPHVLIADVDQHEGLSATKTAIAQGIMTIALSDQPQSVAHYTLKRPLSAKTLLQALSDVQKRPQNTARMMKQPILSAPAPSESQMLRNAQNLLQYLSQDNPSGIVEVRFGLGRSIMFNHTLQHYCSVLPISALLASAHLPIQEVAHGNGQAEAEWKLASRVLVQRPIEDLAWQIAIGEADRQPKKQLMHAKLHLKRLPETSIGLSRSQQSIAVVLKKKTLSVAELAVEAGAPTNEAANFCYAAHVCHLLEVHA
jgi:hypothetical protein